MIGSGLRCGLGVIGVKFGCGWHMVWVWFMVWLE